MDINYSTDDEWGTDIGSDCDAILNSECSLVGGFLHLATGSKNLWDEMGRRLWQGDWQTEEPYVQNVPEPVPVRSQTPREQSVSRYLDMDFEKLEKVCCHQKSTTKGASVKETQSTPDQNLAFMGTKTESTKARESSADARPNTSDLGGKPKFFHLGDYPGTTPYKVSCCNLPLQKVPKMPYFPEIMIKTPSTGTDMKDEPSEDFKQMVEKNKTHKDDFGHKSIMPAFGKTKVALSEAGKERVENLASEVMKVKPARKPKAIKLRHVPATSVRPIVSHTADNSDKNGGRQLGVVTGRKPKRFHRLGAALGRLGQSLRSVFSACSFCARDNEEVV